MSGSGARLPSAIPVIAAATGAIPVIRPARPGPRAATAEYHRTNAATVTRTARYDTARRSDAVSRAAAAGPSAVTPSTANITAPSHTAWTETPQAPWRASRG